jgi:hypothetical protein
MKEHCRTDQLESHHAHNTAVIRVNNCIAYNIHERTDLMSPYDLNAMNDILRILHSASHAI